MVKIDMKGCKPVEFKMNQLTIKAGGNLNKEAPLITKAVMSSLEGGEPKTFIKIRTREVWLTQAVVGKSHRGDMYEGVLKELRDKVMIMEERRRKNVPDPICDNEVEDPMDEMDVADESQFEDIPKKKRSRGSKIAFTAEIAQIQMWEWPPGLAFLAIDSD